MAKSDAAIDEASKPVDEKPVVVSSKRRPNKALKIAAVVAAGVALFAGGVLVAQQFGGDDAANPEQDAFATQQLVASLNQGDALIKDAQAATDSATLQAKGIELQTLAVAMEPLADQFSDQDLREATEKLAQGYLDISIGLVTNSGAKTNSGAETLNQGRELLVDAIGGEQQQDQQGTDQSGTDQQGTDQSGTGTDQQDSGN